MKTSAFKKIIHVVFFFLFMLILNPTYAKKVNNDDLLKVITKVLKKENKEFKKIEKLVPLGIENDTTIYVVKFEKGGFIIISADYSAPPVLGSCFKGDYNTENMPGGLLYLMESYQNEIKSLRDKNVEPSEETQALWDKYLEKSNDKSVELKSVNSVASISSVTPILETSWGQGDYHQTENPRQQTSYNRFCPSGCLAGCVAVGMAQILYHWKWDVNQTGSNTSDGQTINFGGSYYCWDRMSLNSPDDYNSQLIFHAGVSCNTDYCEVSYNSGAFMSNALSGFKNFWGMNSSAELIRRYIINFWPTWTNRLKNDLNLKRPVLYAGGAHTWVIDGYNSNNQFHCNWGLYDGLYDDYFSLGGFNPGPDGQERNYNNNEWAIFNLYPATNVIYSVTGPDILTSQNVTYTIQNTADCMYASWSYTPNIQAVYQSNHWISVKAVSGGVGWLDATYILDGQIHNAPRKYVTCLP